MIINTTLAKISKAIDEIRKAGGSVSAGRVSVKGVKADFAFNDATGKLTVLIIDKPWMVSESFVESEIRKFFT